MDYGPAPGYGPAGKGGGGSDPYHASAVPRVNPATPDLGKVGCHRMRDILWAGDSNNESLQNTPQGGVRQVAYDSWTDGTPRRAASDRSRTTAVDRQRTIARTIPREGHLAHADRF